MLIRFSVENWMSFESKITFSSISTRERQHSGRVPKINMGKLNFGILPIAAIYGGNASGKTNLFKALRFAKKLIVNGTQPNNLIPTDPYKLGSTDTINEVVKFEFELLIKEIIYIFSFSINQKAVLNERLIEITKGREKVLYNRRDNEANFDLSLKENQELVFAFKGTRNNQLFLTNSVSQQIDLFKPVQDWFRCCLVLISPYSKFDPFGEFFAKGSPLSTSMNKMLPQLDTGITHLGGEEVSFENLLLPEPLKMRIKEELPEGFTGTLTTPTNESFVITRKNGILTVKKLVSYHVNSEGKQIKFDIRQESDGSQRIIDLLPAFLDLSQAQFEKVYFIDEVDRSLHPLLIRELLEYYLTNCSSNSRAQLLFTTHNVLLMDQELLRRDEMWITERDAQGASTLFSFSDYKDVRYDKDIRKSYLQGRLGGIPRLSMKGTG